MSISELEKKIARELSKLPPPPPIKPYSFTRREVRDIIIGTVALVGAFTIALSGGYYMFILWNWDTFLFALELSVIAIPTGFLLHELSHKFVAQRYGFVAHFKLWAFGIVIAIVTALVGFIFAAPGAVYIEGGTTTKKQYGKIAISGAVANLIVAGPFLLVFLFTTGVVQVLMFYVAFVNGFLAFFNLLPISPLDGEAVYQWDKKVFFVVFGLAIALVIFGYLYIFL